ncbi:hypothetical protein [Acutalibacter muris]|uniref:hypothetical protein n=1 Tax=Acutalibacter muris TaxID=1796620 RepID=UPI001A9A6E89|nr:hypothetical protein [Acutalibacter muris]
MAERRKLHLYIKLTSNGAGFRAEVKKSHNFVFKTLRGQHLSRSFFALYGVSGRKLQVFFDFQYNVIAKEVEV